MASTSHSFFTLISQSKNVIYGFVSTAILVLLNGGPTRLENTLIVILAFSVWAMLSGILSKWMSVTSLLAHNPDGKEVLDQVINFITTTWAFVIVQMFLIYLRSSVTSSDLGQAEAILGIFISVVAATKLLHTLQVLTL